MEAVVNRKYLFSTATISAVVAVIALFSVCSGKRSVHKNIGNIMLGFAILMTGMQMMAERFLRCVKILPYQDADDVFKPAGAGILVGILFTAVL